MNHSAQDPAGSRGRTTMPNAHQVPEEWKAAMRSISKSLRQQDRSAPFDKCMVGSGGCKQPPIQAHCIPRTTLELIENQEKKVVGVTSQPPRNPAQWINGIHLKPATTSLFTAAIGPAKNTTHIPRSTEGIRHERSLKSFLHCTGPSTSLKEHSTPATNRRPWLDSASKSTQALRRPTVMDERMLH